MANDPRIPILIVDDLPENLTAVTALLDDPGLELVTALSGNEALARSLKTDFALVLLDVQMPGMDGFETARWLHANPKTRHLPIIFVTAGMKDDFHQAKGYDTGAVDYLLKPIQPEVLRAKVQVFCELARQRRELEQRDKVLEELVRKRTAALSASLGELRLSKERYQRLLESITSYVYTVELEAGRPGRTRHGPGCQSVTGYTPEEFQERPFLWYEMVHPEDQAAVTAQAQAILADRRPRTFEHRIFHKDGSQRWVRSTLVPHLGPDGAVATYDGVILDITGQKRSEEDRHQLERLLFRAQRLESLGNLAGGVAHDLNNVLAAILGLATANRENLEPGGFLAQSLDTITTACLRGRDVVKSLLYFARQDLESSGPVDVNILVKEVVALLQATTLKRVRLATDLAEPLATIQGDPAALSHALMNLCLNSVDAMPDGGDLLLRTCPAAQGWVEIRVIDSGEGMSPEVLERAIDPFFTTKPLGKGTGLGLAMAYGTAKAHGGALDIRSVPGQGTEVVLAFPPFQDAAGPQPAAEPEPAAVPATPGRRILLVDDDELIRESIPLLLETFGHQVRTAAGGQEALDLLEGGLPVDLVILDLRMPGLSGAETLPRLRALRPDLPVLLATGHSDQEVQPLLAAGHNLACIRKPFTLKEIREKIQDPSSWT